MLTTHPTAIYRRNRNMLSKRENFLETIKKGGKPDRLVKQYEAFGMVFGNPITNYVKGKSFPGMAPTADLWGTVTIWPAGAPGPMPLPRCGARPPGAVCIPLPVSWIDPSFSYPMSMPDL